MKTNLIIALTVLLSSLSFAQPVKMMTIYQNDGKVLYVPLSKIDSVKHNESGFSSVTFNGYNYPTVILGNGQEWFTENLRTAKYANGDDITNILGPELAGQWSSTEGWAWYNNDSTYENSYGKLYNWYAAHDSRNVCPTGWHVPTDEEWTLLTNYFGGESVAGTKLKSTNGWIKVGNATNESALNFLPSGYHFYFGFNECSGYNGNWWSSSEYSAHAWYRYLTSGDGFYRNHVNKDSGFAIRCLRD